LVARRTALNEQNVELPSGKLTGDNTELTVKNEQRRKSSTTNIRTDGATIVRLSDIGKAELGPENIETN
jgi:HAE1 family hydrophobic/amphiphilic exporter-1/multidrug efflux pump